MAKIEATSLKREETEGKNDPLLRDHCIVGTGSAAMRIVLGLILKAIPVRDLGHRQYHRWYQKCLVPGRGHAPLFCWCWVIEIRQDCNVRCRSCLSIAWVGLGQGRESLGMVLKKSISPRLFVGTGGGGKSFWPLVSLVAAICLSVTLVVLRRSRQIQQHMQNSFAGAFL